MQKQFHPAKNRPRNDLPRRRERIIPKVEINIDHNKAILKSSLANRIRPASAIFIGR